MAMASRRVKSAKCDRSASREDTAGSPSRRRAQAWRHLFVTPGVSALSTFYSLGIPLLSMLAQIQAQQFRVNLDTSRQDELEPLHQHNGHPSGKGPRGNDGHALREELIGIAEKQPVAAVGIDRCRGEQAGRDHAPGPS